MRRKVTPRGCRLATIEIAPESLKIQLAQKALGCRNIRNAVSEIKMIWYAAHAIVSIRPVKVQKRDVVVYENVILISAKSEQEATSVMSRK
jgi:hypothetical protein